MGPPDRVKAIVRADLDGNGTTELVVADASGVQVRGRDGWRQAWVAPAKLRHPQSITAGDIDGDGDLDLWVTQYRLPFVNGQFPTPYYDANDGFPSYLLRNDGTQWLDITEVSGLASKRYRRTYSASWLDLDGDGDLDLVNVSDFAGLDFYRNDGRGHFTDMTSGLGLTRHAFGMAHVVWDANHDALPDLLMVGMDSPVASQLDALGLGRSEFPGHTVHRGAMTYGNRLFVGSRSRGMELSPLSEDLRRAGWAWGLRCWIGTTTDETTFIWSMGMRPSKVGPSLSASSGSTIYTSADQLPIRQPSSTSCRPMSGVGPPGSPTVGGRPIDYSPRRSGTPSSRMLGSLGWQ